MARRTTRADTEAAAAQASEAARVLAQRSHETRSEPTETVQETPPEDHTPPEQMEKLLKARPSVQSREEIIKRRGLDVEEQPKEEEPKAEPKVEAQPEPEAKTEPEPEAPKTVKVKVDGEEFEAPADEVEAAGGVKSYQMMKASENRLAKASKLAEETRQAQAQTAQLVQALLKQQQPKAQPEQSDAEFIASKLQSIRFADDKEGAAALLEVLNRGRQNLDQQTIVNQATNRINNQLAVSKFKTEYSDVLSNPTLTKLAISLEREYASQLPQGEIVDWDNFYRKIGNEIRAVVPARQSQPTTTAKTDGTTSQPSVKEERKASITTIPTAAARAVRPEPEKEMSPEEERKAWIASQKKSRGQG